jgi:hypothetical protein
MSRSAVSAGSELLDLYTMDVDRAMLEGVDRIFQSADDVVSRPVLDVFTQFIKEHKRFPEATSAKVFDSLIEGLLNVCNTNPSPEAGRAMSVLLAFLTSGSLLQ